MMASVLQLWHRVGVENTLIISTSAQKLTYIKLNRKRKNNIMNQCDYFFNDVNGWILVFTSYFNIFTLFMFLFCPRTFCCPINFF